MQYLATQPTAVFPTSLQQGIPPLIGQLVYVDANTLPKLRPDTAGWIAVHTQYDATMSGSEYKEYETVRANDTIDMPGRLGVKESLHSVYMHVAGLRGFQRSSWFCLQSASGAGYVILVDCIRMDLSHQTIFLDAALIPLRASDGLARLAVLAQLSNKPVLIMINEDEKRFWRHLLPTFAERCRQWKHKRTCEYQVAGCMPISTEADEHVVCSCGLGRFPEEYLAEMKAFKHFADLAVRAAIPVIFASPISEDNVRIAALRSPPVRRGRDKEPKAVGCLKCGAASTKAGNSLLKCAKCKTAQYCSPDCQKKDWKKHKRACKHSQEQTIGDDAA